MNDPSIFFFFLYRREHGESATDILITTPVCLSSVTLDTSIIFFMRTKCQITLNNNYMNMERGWAQ